MFFIEFSGGIDEWETVCDVLDEPLRLMLTMLFVSECSTFF